MNGELPLDVIRQGDVREILAELPEQYVHCVVTSPPYWGLRDYGVEGQLGLEQTPEEYVDAMVDVFRGVRRVLRDDGTLWLNLGDSYAGSWGAQSKDDYEETSFQATEGYGGKKTRTRTGSWVNDHPILKPKDLIGIPWRVALALQADGWLLRSDVIWNKPNPMPESVTDRPSKAHEYLFMLTKSPQYYYDADAIRVPLAAGSVGRLNQDIESQEGSHRANAGAKTNGPMRAVGSIRGANKKSVWTVPVASFKEAHFATFPQALIEPCIKAGSPIKGIVLDPFMGSGTTAVTSHQLGRHYLGIELNPEYIKIAEKRIELEGAHRCARLTEWGVSA